MRIFLTGGTGLVGQPLTRALLRRGWEYRTRSQPGQQGCARDSGDGRTSGQRCRDRP